MKNVFFNKFLGSSVKILFFFLFFFPLPCFSFLSIFLFFVFVLLLLQMSLCILKNVLSGLFSLNDIFFLLFRIEMTHTD